jgi:hypothetical protein
LTSKSLQLYRQIYDCLDKDSNGNVNSKLWSQIASIIHLHLVVPVTVALLHLIENSNSWRLKVHECQHILQPYYPEFDRNITLAFLYLLHMSSSSIGLGDVGLHAFSPERIDMIARFDIWISCACHCGSRWNFARDGGLHDDADRSRPCLVAKWLNRSGMDRATSMFSTQLNMGRKFYDESLLAWRRLPTNQFKY